MAPFVTRKGDAELILALTAGASVRQAVKRAKVSERTAHRRLSDRDYRRRIDAARAEMISQATGQLAKTATDAGRLRWLEWLDEFPAKLLDGVLGDRIAEIRAVCRAVGMRVRASELRTHPDIARQLPEEAVRGIAARRYPALRMSRAVSTTNMTR